MNTEELIELVRDLFLGGDPSFPIEAETHLLEDGICDSLGMVRLAGEVESRTEGIAIDDQEIVRENFGSVAAILKFLETKTA